MQELNPLVRKLLEKRGITEKDDIEEFLSLSPKRTYDPFLMPGMKEGVKQVLDHCRKGSRICIYGDYDADGITSVTIMMQTLSHLTDNLFYYIPSRFDEGYGLNTEAVRYLRKQGTDFILTVDCGSVSVEEVKLAKELGMDILVTDHHNMGEEAPDCIVLNPKKEPCSYPFNGLAGCGVAFKLCCAIQREAGLDRDIIRSILDVAAIGTIGDIVPLVDENRTIVKYGLKAIRSGMRPGLKALIEGTGLSLSGIDEGNIAYTIVPHLNAAGRIGDAALGARVLLSQDEGEIEEGVRELIERNRERKRIQSETYNLCVDIAKEQARTRNSIVIRCDEAHEGITGIVAGKLRERFSRPVIILTPSEGGLKGTGRSTSKINLYHLLKGSESYFSRFGGHKAACGFTMDTEYFTDFMAEIEERLSENVRKDPKLLIEEIDVDMILEGGDISMELADQIEALAPFGQENEKPVFQVSGVKLTDIYYMGAEKNHVRFTAYDSRGNYFKCVLFGKAEEYRAVLHAEGTVCLVGNIEISRWKDKTGVQMLIKDISLE